MSRPETIGNYLLGDKLGQGGMGAVYKAVHQTLQRNAAVKILPAEFASNSDYVQRFLREARTLAALRHENVVQIYDAGEENGLYYIAMELVDGCNLLKYIEEQGRLKEDEGLELLMQAARGLAAAHAQNLVHRDIKPENLLLDKNRRLHIVDFGLVMETSSTTQLTATGACLGTPMYMSPEQADGEQADARTDLYALGVTFYRAFTGQAPFTSPTVMNILFKHKFEAPPNPKSLQPELSENSSNLLLHLMAKRREDRPQTAQALAGMIEDVRSGRRISPPPSFVPPVPVQVGVTMIAEPSAQAGVAAPASYRRKLHVLVLAVGLLLLGVAYFIWLAPSRKSSGQTAETPLADVSSKPDLKTRGDAQFQAGNYTEALEYYREAQSAAPQDGELKTRIERTTKKLNFQDLLRRGQALEAQGELEDAIALYAQAVKLDEDGEKGAARKCLEEARETLSQRNRTTPEAAQKLSQIEEASKKAKEAEQAGNYEAAAVLYSRAAALAEGVYKASFAEQANECRRRDCLAKARAAESRQDYDAAVELYEAAQKNKADPQLASKLDAVKKLRDNERAYTAAMRAGQAALERKDYQTARMQFLIARPLKPELAEATEKLKELDGLETSRAAVVSIPEATVETAIGKAHRLIAEGKDKEALDEVLNTWRVQPANSALKDLKAGLENFLACRSLYDETQKIMAEALSTIQDIRDIDDDDHNREFRKVYRNLSEKFKDRLENARSLLLDANYADVKKSLANAHKDAQHLADELFVTATDLDKRAEKAGEGVVFFGGSDKKKKDKYQRFAETFRTLANQARPLKE
jgi:serine/threonine protein kinase